MKKLVKLVKLNNLEYNANRDPAVYRRCANENFRIQALIDSTGKVECSLTDSSGKLLNQQSIDAPGTYTHEIGFATPGVRIVTDHQGSKPNHHSRFTAGCHGTRLARLSARKSKTHQSAHSCALAPAFSNSCSGGSLKNTGQDAW